MVFTAVSIATTLAGDKYVADFDIHGHTHTDTHRDITTIDTYRLIS